MKPKIAIILSREGIDTISVLSADSEERKEAYNLCSLIEDEIENFQRAITSKIQHAEKEKEKNFN